MLEDCCLSIETTLALSIKNIMVFFFLASIGTLDTIDSCLQFLVDAFDRYFQGSHLHDQSDQASHSLFPLILEEI